MKRLLILGRGYTGGALQVYLQNHHPEVQLTCTRRQADTSATHFDLQDPRSWANLEPSDATVWMFPAQPLKAVRAFWQERGHDLGKLVVVGSTGSLMPNALGEVDEHSACDTQADRVAGELFLQSVGACVVHAAGIYGPGRSPRTWLLEGRISDMNRTVNLIHVQDLAAALWGAVQHGIPGQRYVVSDTQPYVWKDLATIFGQLFKETYPLGQPRRDQAPAKKVLSQKSLEKLRVTLLYPSAIEAVRAGL